MNKISVNINQCNRKLYQNYALSYRKYFLNSNDRLGSAAENNFQLVNCKITKRLNKIRAWQEMFYYINTLKSCSVI